MSTVAHTEAVLTDTVVSARPGAMFWVCRYLPAEVAGTAALILAGVAVTFWTGIPAVIALAALIGECLGFYGVLAITLRLDVDHASDAGRVPIARTLAAEFGAPETIDTFVVRPIALLLGVLLVSDPVWGLLAGKIAADLVFYTMVSRVVPRSARPDVEGGAS